MNKVLRHTFAPIAGVATYIFSYMILLSLFLFFVRVNAIEDYNEEVIHKILDILFAIIATFAQLYITKKTAPKIYLVHVVISFVIFFLFENVIGRFSFYIDDYRSSTRDFFSIINEEILLVGLIIAVADTIITAIENKKAKLKSNPDFWRLGVEQSAQNLLSEHHNNIDAAIIIAQAQKDIAQKELHEIENKKPIYNNNMSLRTFSDELHAWKHKMNELEECHYTWSSIRVELLNQKNRKK